MCGRVREWNRTGVVNTIDHRVLRWFGHVERMDEYHMVRRALIAEVESVYRVDQG